ncbi:cell wall elongation regulator TseB-like domain-containing protein [Paenibacillus agricola]|uniref:DUF5590 domain-containing protein n=1 Tax=Paenibacillus agricola TaxID=2716264 RepID=A0ABX0IXK4_9BACL|nr:DUF5590 domain-containing protein [Paenibacillus agricola]NHN28679.1 DUF5590 domain-containing protein [Paenibacillus agricola]
MKIRITAAACVAAALLLFLCIQFYNSVQEKEWALQRADVQTAYEKTILTKASKVEKFVGEQTYTIIHGEDKIGQKLIVWVGGNQIFSQMAADGMTSEAIKAIVLTRQPAANLKRIVPGVWNGNLVWEVFYKIDAEASNPDRYYYDYYAFKDGVWMDTYRLSIQ